MKKFISLFTTLCIVFSMLGTFTVFAEETAADLELSTLAELEAFRDDVNSGNTYEGKTVKLTADIDMSEKYGEDINGEEVSWEPIGHGVYIDNVCPAFKGVFDGCGHELKNLYVNKNSDYDAVGLFGDIIYGTVKNLTVSGSVHGEGLFTGGIAGTISDGEIINCVNKAKVTGTGFCIGGIAGVNYGVIKGCENAGEIRQNGEYAGDAGFFNYYVAGIVGLNGAYSGVKGFVEDCCNIGRISSGSENKGSYPNEDMIAGIVGFNDYGVVKNCYNAGVLSAERYDVGAIAGINDINVTLRNGVIENCYYLCTEDFNKYYHAVALDRNSEDTTVYSNNTEEFASGKVAYLLGEAWGQEIGIDEYPVLGGKKVYFVNGEYTNTPPQEKTYPYEITALRFTDVSGNEIIAPEQGKSFIVEADIIKTEERSEKDYLFVAVYDENCALMSLDYVKAKFALNGECSFGFNIPAQDKAVGSVKAFVWNTFNSAEPLAETKILAPVIFE